ncbi:MAG: signal recognition particle protein [Spirochaetales bacterium]|nr:signal recognition particle protein [Spirochaetales bacterium]
MLEKISNKFTDVFRQLSGKAVISEKNIQDAVEEIKIALLEADVNVRIVRRFINSTIKEASGEAVLKSVNPGQQFTKIVYDKMVDLLGDKKADLNLKGPDTLSVIMMMGLQGSGKTTTASKLAYKLKQQGRKPLLVAADLARPAAVKQLQVMGEKAGVEVFALEETKPVKVVKAALAYAKKNLHNVVIIDTAGRIHLDDVLMAEVSDIKKTANPDDLLFVADSMTGQNAVNIAKEFNEQVGITGVVLTKFDSDTRGGAALSLKSVTGCPLKFVGTGEKLEDLDVFHPERMASRILGMGDVVSFVEKAQETIEEKEAEDLERKIRKAQFTLEDYLDQFKRIRKMGSFSSLLEMMPGGANIDPSAIDEKKIKRQEAIIFSMTLAERRNHHIIGPTRRKRIAKGSGTTVFDVNKLLKDFEKMRLMMKKVANNKKYQAQMLSQFGGLK